MKRFCIKIFLFLLPLLILGVTAEILLRNIPNDYSYKKDYLDKNSDSLKVLFLGSSHAFRDINPAFIKLKSFNAGYVSQSLFYDYKILKQYEGRLKNLKYIVIPISYFSLNSKLEVGTESWRVKNYMIYYGMHCSLNPSDYFEISSNTVKVNLSRIYSYFILKMENKTCSALGWGTKFNFVKGSNLDMSGKEAAKRHTKNTDEYFEENLLTLVSIIDFAKSNKIQVILFTPPAFHTYVQNLEKKQLEQLVSTGIEMGKKNTNVNYFNFLTDSSFTEMDFFDADHLNEYGAKKFSLMMNEIISNDSIR